MIRADIRVRSIIYLNQNLLDSSPPEADQDDKIATNFKSHPDSYRDK